MASKFQNRMAGTIILVAIGVILLPGLLDGKKKHYHEDFAAIPLVPKAGDSQEVDQLPLVTQPVPSQIIQQQAPAKILGTDDSSAVAPETANPNQAEHEHELAQEVQQRPEQIAQQQVAQQPKQQTVARQSQQQAERARQQAMERQQALQQFSEQPTSNATTSSSSSAGQAYVIQLGAFRNADKVSQLVSELRGAGFQAYSIPRTPVAGQINRILVGPDASKSHLQSQVSALKAKTGLSGVVMPYRVH